jgi:hypothetical protein
MADLEPRRRDLANALAAEADQIPRRALVDHQIEAADRRAPVAAGGEDVADPLLGDDPPGLLHQPVDAGEESRIDAVIGDHPASFGRGSEAGYRKAGADASAGARNVAMLDDEIAAGREDLLPVPSLLFGPGRHQMAFPAMAVVIFVDRSETQLEQPVAIGLAQPIERRAVGVRRQAERLQVCGAIGAAERSPSLHSHGDRTPVYGGSKIFWIGGVAEILLGAIAVGHREGDKGADVARRAIAEDVADPNLVGGDEQVFGDHVDVGASGEDEAARIVAGGAVVGRGRRGERRGRQKGGDHFHASEPNGSPRRVKVTVPVS